MDELLKISYTELNLTDLAETQDVLRQRLHASLIELVRERNP
jgi:hypothetical protein